MPNQVPHTRMLLNTHFLSVQAEMAVMLGKMSGKRSTGLNMAIVLQQVYFNMDGKASDFQTESDPEKRKGILRSYKDERWWVFDSYPDWREKQFPFWSVSTIKEAFLALEKTGVIISRQFEVQFYERRKWYTIDFEHLDDLIDMFLDERRVDSCRRAQVTPIVRRRLRPSPSESSSKSSTEEEPPSLFQAARELGNGEKNQSLMEEQAPVGEQGEPLAPIANDSQQDSAAERTDMVCPEHGVPFRRFEKDGETWYAHKLPGGGWCRREPSPLPAPEGMVQVLTEDGYLHFTPAQINERVGYRMYDENGQPVPEGVKDVEQLSERVSGSHRLPAVPHIPGSRGAEVAGGAEGLTPPTDDGATGAQAEDARSQADSVGSPSGGLLLAAEKYWAARRAQEQDHTDEALNFKRSEAHDLLMAQMMVEGIEFEDREDAAQIALKMLEL